MSSGAIWPAMTTAGFLPQQLRRSALRHFCPARYGQDNPRPRVPGARGPGSGPRSLRSRSQILGQTPPSCWYPRDSSIVRGHRVQAGTRPARRRCDSSGSLPSAGTFHTSVTHRRGRAVTNSRDRAAENHWPHRVPTTGRDASPVHDRHRWEISAFSRFYM